MNEARIIELEIKLAYQEDLLQTLNRIAAEQQTELSKLRETCKRLDEKINSLAAGAPPNGSGLADAWPQEKPPHY